MKITSICSPVFYQVQNNNKIKSNICFANPVLSRDVVSFSGTPDFLSLPKKEIFRRIDDALKNQENKLGEGSEAYVYKIPETPYCVRINKEAEKSYDKALILEVGEQDKVNHVVANLGRGSSIMTIIDGSPIWAGGMPHEQVAKNIEVVSSIPVEGFRNLINQVCHAKSCDMFFDSIATNVIVNPVNRSLTAIDFFRTQFYEPFTPLRSIYSSLTHFDCPDAYKRDCASKIILAACDEINEGKNSKVPLGGYDFGKLIYKLATDNVIRDKSFTGTLYKTLDAIEALNIKSQVGQDCKSQIEGQMKVLKVLLKQVF
jgi:hypothetical protein